MTPAIIYKETRKNFPNAQQCRTHDGSQYCVLGALRLQIMPDNEKYKRTFNPDYSAGAEILSRANPRLSLNEALKYSSKISRANDSNEIERAWKILKLVLTTRPKQPRS